MGSLTVVTRLFVYLASLPILYLITTGIIRDIVLYLHALGLAWLLFSFTPSSTTQPNGGQNDMYDLRHVTFNLEIPPKTLWFNMGLWYDDDNEQDNKNNKENEKHMKYSHACERLVEAVIQQMEMKHSSRVLDVGYGCGDSCFLLADRYGCHVTGLTNEKSQWSVSQQRLTSLPCKDQVQLVCASATDDDFTFTHNNSNNDKTFYDHIICIDSAYHYLTRKKFLQTALTHLIPGGSLGLYDLTLHPQLLFNNNSVVKKWIVEFFGQSILGIPKENMITAEMYRDQLKTMGYDQVKVTTLCGDRVLGGLSRFIHRQYQQAATWDILPPLGNRVFMMSSASLFGYLARKQWVVPVIVSAHKKKEE
ncbi:S-adenosyl-L-methionine-dependent methyltransferase [Phascolomyces articulosus]|uniref:phosphoethanolamine N-methyltransferase n=1 Tax=Phascolomyces articulosus TaxID=60185 RepID=A0AAD5K809_9FUNG|nr:S-adenosyl-L-methionine-dependent methyltransferase [Phascolomyces articulosus]